VFEVGLDWQALGSWVDREVAWVPYQGLLRGSKGVLLDRRGNSLDQAVLAAELMYLAGFDVRLVRTELSAEMSERLLPVVLAESVAMLEALEEPALQTDEIVGRLAELGADPDAAGVAVRDALSLMESITAHVQETVAWQSDVLAGSLDDSLTAGDDLGRFVSALQDHWWVQVDDGTGETWHDVDVVLGAHLRELGVERPEPSAVVMPGEVPDDLMHRVEVRVVSERWEAGQYVHEVSLARAFDASHMIGVPISLSLTPLHSLPGESELDDDARAISYARDTQEWLPVLRVGSEVEWDKSIELDGRVNDSPNLNLLTQRFAQATRGLGALGTPSTAQASHLTAVWIEYASTVPGVGEHVVRRERFDLFGGRDRAADGVPAEVTIADADVVQRGLMLLAETSILISASWLGDEYLQHLMSVSVLDNLEQVKQLVPGVIDPAQAPDQDASLFAELTVLPMELLTYERNRSAMSQRRSSVYLGRPSIVSKHDFAVPSAARLDWFRSIDIVVNNVDVLPSPGVEPRLVRLEQGVLDSVVEVLANAVEIDGFDLASRRNGNAASLLAASSQDGVDWVLLQSRQSLDDVRAAIPEEVAVRVQGQLQRGTIVFAPTSAVRTGEDDVLSWWSIDPVTGTTLSIGPRGWGSESGEFAVVTTKSSFLQKVGAATVGAFVFCAFMATIVVVLYGVVVGSLVHPGVSAVIGLVAWDAMKKAWALCLAVS
jgi:hypothetical protein